MLSGAEISPADDEKTGIPSTSGQRVQVFPCVGCRKDRVDSDGQGTSEPLHRSSETVNEEGKVYFQAFRCSSSDVGAPKKTEYHSKPLSKH